MGSQSRSNWPAPIRPGLVASILGVALAGAAPPGEDLRVPWTTSHVVGTPEAPLPYAAEPAFPKLSFHRPVLLTQTPGSRRLVVAELGGKVFSFPDDPGVDHADLALDLAGTRTRGRFGSLYGLAFHPRFEENRKVFVCYTLPGDKPEGTRVSQFVASRTDPDPLWIDADSEEIVITFPSGGHNGGCLAFGADGFLYISTGDNATPAPPDPLLTGQDLSDLLSSILRIDIDRHDPGKRYRIPPDNPFVSLAGARPEIWAYGFRNPWRMSFDRTTGDLWVGDVGWELWELIYRVVRGGNYGWSIMEGRQTVRPEGQRGPTPILPPTIDHPHSEAASITGGYVYRGSRLKELVGTYLYGDYQSGKVWGVRHDGQRVTWQGELADTGLRLASFGEDRAGELYLVEFERTDQIYRLIANPSPKAPRDFPRTLSQTGLFAATRDHTPAPGVVAYAINAELWADGARAERLLAIPGTGQIEVDPTGYWKLPEGSVLARTISLDVLEGQSPQPRRRRLETQMLHREGGSWRPYTYLWNDEQTDATLADAAGSSRTMTVRDDRAPGGRRTLAYRFAARSECVLCHSPWVEARTTIFGIQSASPLALDASQLNRDGPGVGARENQLRQLERLGYFARPLAATKGAGLPRLADPYDEAADLDARARAYLQVNCAHCHRSGAGGSANIELASSLKLAETRTVDIPPLQGMFGIADAKIIAPGEPERSVLYYRIAKLGAGRMPRIGGQSVDERATRLIADWIAHLPGPRRPAEDPAAALAALRAAPDSTLAALAVVRLIDAGSIPESTIRAIVALTRGHSRAEVRDLFERFVPEAERVERLGEAIDPEVILKRTGDVRRGAEWFNAESATNCKSCHRIGGIGVELGPDLDGIGAKYSRRDLLRHILEPSREVDPRYAVHAVATTAGQIHQGLLVEKTAREVVLRDVQNRTIRIAVADIEQQTAQPASLMPVGLLRDLSAQQAADLLEYLCSLKKQ